MSVSKQELIPALAEKLKSVLEKPEWADFVKTGIHNERPPIDENWWFMRGASILLKVKDLGPIGVSKLRTRYGGRKNRGVKPEKFKRASGNHIRKLLQQLEKNDLLKSADKNSKHKGKVITPKAQSMIAQTSKTIEKKE